MILRRGNVHKPSLLNMNECVSTRSTKSNEYMEDYFGVEVEFKRYIMYFRGIVIVSRLLFNCRSGTHGLNEELEEGMA